MTEAHEIFVGDKIQRALRLLSEEPASEFEMLGRAVREVEHDVELRGNYLRVEVDPDAE